MPTSLQQLNIFEDTSYQSSHSNFSGTCKWKIVNLYKTLRFPPLYNNVKSKRLETYSYNVGLVQVLSKLPSNVANYVTCTRVKTKTLSIKSYSFSYYVRQYEDQWKNGNNITQWIQFETVNH
jgi:hypothetical protein